MKTAGSATISFLLTFAVGWFLISLLASPNADAALEQTDHPEGCSNSAAGPPPCEKPWDGGLKKAYEVPIEGAGQWWQCSWGWINNTQFYQGRGREGLGAMPTPRASTPDIPFGSQDWAWQCRQLGDLDDPPQAPAPPPLLSARPPCPPEEMHGNCPSCDAWLHPQRPTSGTEPSTAAPGKVAAVSPWAISSQTAIGLAAARQAAEQAKARAIAMWSVLPTSVPLPVIPTAQPPAPSPATSVNVPWPAPPTVPTGGGIVPMGGSGPQPQPSGSIAAPSQGRPAPRWTWSLLR